MINRKVQARNERIKVTLTVIGLLLTMFIIFRIALQQQFDDDCQTLPLNQAQDIGC